MNNNLRIIIALRDLIDEDSNLKNLYLSNNQFHLVVEQLIQRLHGTTEILVSEVIHELRTAGNIDETKLYSLL